MQCLTLSATSSGPILPLNTSFTLYIIKCGQGHDETKEDQEWIPVVSVKLNFWLQMDWDGHDMKQVAVPCTEWEQGNR